MPWIYENEFGHMNSYIHEYMEKNRTGQAGGEHHGVVEHLQLLRLTHAHAGYRKLYNRGFSFDSYISTSYAIFQLFRRATPVKECKDPHHPGNSHGGHQYDSGAPPFTSVVF